MINRPRPGTRKFPERKAAFGGTLCTIAGWRCTQYDGIVAIADCEHFERSRGSRFDGGWYVGRRNRPCFGGPAGDRLRNPGQGVQFRQHADSHRRDGRLLRRDHARARDGGAGAENYRATARRRKAGAARGNAGAGGWAPPPGDAAAFFRGAERAASAVGPKPPPPPPWQDEAAPRDRPREPEPA